MKVLAEVGDWIRVGEPLPRPWWRRVADWALCWFRWNAGKCCPHCGQYRRIVAVVDETTITLDAAAPDGRSGGTYHLREKSPK